MQWISTVVSSSPAELLAALNAPPEAAAIAEIRIALSDDADISIAVAASPLPILATYRSRTEGGRGSSDPEHRQSVLQRAVESGAHLIDLEWARDRRLIRELGLPAEKVILSWHDMKNTPAAITEVAAAMLEEPVALVKIVTTVRSLADLERILRLSTSSGTTRKQDRSRLIAFGMGPVGAPSRYLAPLLGAPVGFSSWSSDSPAAPGQKTARWMNAAAGHLQGPPRRLFGVIGLNVTSSLSPALHGRAFSATGIPDLLVPVSVPDPSELDQLFVPLGETLFDRLGLPVHGWAVTTPYKLMAAEAATECVPRVRRAGAANTLLLKSNRIIAENTDADGVVGSLTAAGVDLAGVTALVQGTGGAARGATIGLHLAGAEVILRGRNASTTQEVAKILDVAWCHPDDRPGAEILINATPLGRSDDDPSPFTEPEVEEAEAVVDMVYGGTPTALVRAAISSGTIAVDGRTMLAYQGMAQFAAFTTMPPPREVILETVTRQALSSF